MSEKQDFECFNVEIPTYIVKQWLELDDNKSNEKLFKKSLNNVLIKTIIEQYKQSLEQ